MFDYPVNLNLQGRLCTVIGAGNIGMRKVRSLRAAGALVRLIAPKTCEPPPGGVEWVVREYRSGDLSGSFLAFAATDIPEVNTEVTSEARQMGIPVCVTDTPEQGDFSLPALLRRGNLLLGVSTSGASPALAVALRDHLGELLGPEWSKVVEIAAALRQSRLTPGNRGEYNHRVFHRLIEAGLPTLIATRDRASIDQLLAECCGEAISLGALGIHLNEGNS